MTKKRAVKTVSVIAAGACLLAGILLYCADRGMFLPGWIRWTEKTDEADLDGDGRKEKLSLEGKHFSVRTESGEAAALKSGWFVSDYLTADINRDEIPEVLLLVWKRGSYGSSRPFWVKQDERRFSQHVGIYQYREGKLQPAWMSSGLGISVADWALDEEHKIHLFDTDGGETVWMWEHFGLTLLENRTEEKTGHAAESEVTLIAVGDNIAHGSVCREAWNGETGAYDFSDMYEHVAPEIGTYDLACVNQETIFTSDLSRVSSFPEFGTPEAMGDALHEAGFNIVCAATNHTNDLGEDGLTDTLKFWNGYPDVTLLGLHETKRDADSIPYLEKNGIRFALFDCTEQLNGHFLPENEIWKIDCDEDRLTRQVQKAENDADYTICFLHAGEEYSAEPSEPVKALAETLIDAGADVLIFTHPHVLQTFGEVTTENGNSGIVYWSLGNFLSHQTRPETVLGGAALLKFRKPANSSESVTFARVQEPQSGRTESEADISYGMEPTVCHFGSGGTRVYFLKDYTEELATKHSINKEGTVFTAASLREDWRRLQTLTVSSDSR